MPKFQDLKKKVTNKIQLKIFNNCLKNEEEKNFST